jgi:hypothetical protein
VQFITGRDLAKWPVRESLSDFTTNRNRGSLLRADILPLFS